MDHIKLYVNKKEIVKNTGVSFDNLNDYIYYIQRLIEDLESNNKNYTKKQYFKILDIKEILENITTEESEATF